MSAVTYDREKALRLLRLLESIAREIEDRDEALRRVDAELRELERAGRGRSREAGCLNAEASLHLRELRCARSEIEGLGCSVIGFDPPTVRIPGPKGSQTPGWLWQLGQACLREVRSLEIAGVVEGAG